MNAIKIDNLSKKFTLSRGPKTLKEYIIHGLSSKNHSEYWALKNINLEIKKGQSVGIIGSNGSGKSTLLKIISKILYPTSGLVEVNGKISSLIELGAGFKPEYTGRENIYLNASILGLSKKEISQKYDSIVEFSELRDFIDQPIRTYSSGMYMRLAYSVAVSTDPDILLIDEILAVGDNQFKEKGLKKILELKENGTTIVLVSHSNDMIKKVCDHAVWLEKGNKILEGSVEEVIERYKKGI